MHSEEKLLYSSAGTDSSPVNMCETNKGEQTSLTETFPIILIHEEAVLIAKAVWNVDQKKKGAEQSYNVRMFENVLKSGKDKSEGFL